MLQPTTLPDLSRRELMIAFSAMGLLQSVPPALAGAGLPPATLAKLFPDLFDLPDATNFGIAYGWMGLSPLSPIDIFFPLELRNDRFEGEARFKMASASAKQAVAIPHDTIKSFLVAVRDVELVEGTYQAAINHTDDYPSLNFYVQTGHGELHIWTNSQDRQPTTGSPSAADRTPWAIAYQGRTFVVTSRALDEAFDPIATYVWPDEIHKQLVDQVKAHEQQHQ
jgi:hypothetical protein